MITRADYFVIVATLLLLPTLYLTYWAIMPRPTPPISWPPTAGNSACP